MLGFEDLKLAQGEPRVVRLGFYAPDDPSLFTAERLYEYDIILLAPSPRLFELPDQAAGTKIDDSLYERIEQEITERAGELRSFLSRGGLLIAFLLWSEPVHGRVGSGLDELHPLHFVVPRDRLEGMGLREATGSTILLLDSDEAFGAYLRTCKKWGMTMRRGVLAADLAGYALAESRGHETVAYVEHLGAGAIYWLPLSDGLDVLRRTAVDVWRAGQVALGDVEEARHLRDRIAKLTSSYVGERARLGADLERIRSEHARFIQDHPRLQKVRERFHSAQRSPPAKALDYLSRMLELIEEEFGGRKKAEAALGIRPALWSSITSPANDPVLGARHEASDRDPVPTARLAKAQSGAREILDKYTIYLREKWGSPHR